MLITTTISIILLCLSLTELKADRANISLLNSIENGRHVNVFVSFAQGTSKVIQKQSLKKFSTRAEQLTDLTAALKENAQTSQEKVLNFLNTQKSSLPSISVTSFWITNQLFIKGANHDLIEKLANFENVFKISEEENYVLDAPVKIEKSSKPKNNSTQWGVLKVKAPECWEDENGNDGTGIVIGTIDSGVRVTHEAVSHNYVGEYGWFDPSKGEETPNDQSGHGTHTLATIVGRYGIGVAPGAKWMTCRGCYKGFCKPEDLLACGQFLLCPTDPKGQNPNCSKAPHIASCSFGGGQGRDLLWQVFDAWLAAEMTIVFSNGNSGPWCGTANSHADAPQVIGVGGTTLEDSLYTFSSVGPSVYDTIKPDISAPGVNVVSAYYTADDEYFSMSGTSMAAPHVAGAVAILRSQKLNLSLEDVKWYLSQGAEKNLVITGQNCGGITEDVFPNHVYGGGRIDILRSLRLLQEAKN